MLLRLPSLGQNQDVEVHIVNTGKRLPAPLCPSVTDLWLRAQEVGQKITPVPESILEKLFWDKPASFLHAPGPAEAWHIVCPRPQGAFVMDMHAAKAAEWHHWSELIRSRMQNAKSRAMWRKVSRNYFLVVRHKVPVNKREGEENALH